MRVLTAPNGRIDPFEMTHVTLQLTEKIAITAPIAVSHFHVDICVILIHQLMLQKIFSKFLPGSNFSELAKHPIKIITGGIAVIY